MFATIRRMLPGLIFMALFPGFFFYHAMLGFNLIPPVLGGFFGQIALISFPILIWIFFSYLSKGRIQLTKLDALFAILMFYALLVYLYHYALSGGSGMDYELLIWSLAGILFNWTTYLLAKTIDLKSNLMRNIGLCLLAAMFFLVVLNVGEIGIFNLAQDSANPETVATYQGFGRSILVTALFTLALVRGKVLFFIFSLMALFALFFNGARSELIGFILGAALLSSGKFGGGKLFVFAIFGLIGLLLTYDFTSDKSYNYYFADNRLWDLLKAGESSSYSARSELSVAALNSIMNNPLFGDYGSYAHRAGIGTYAHNILSAWVNLGLIGFLGYIFIFSSMIYWLTKGRRHIGAGGPSGFLAVAFVGLALVLLLFAKDYSYMLFGMAVGFYTRAMSDLKLAKNQNSSVWGRGKMNISTLR